SDWGEDAFKFLQDALNYADGLLAPPNPVDLVEIRVAQGTYLPTQSRNAVADDESCLLCDGSYYCARCCEFRLRTNVRILGGYDGISDVRDPAVYETILSGDLNGDDYFEFVKADEEDIGMTFDNYDENSAIIVSARGVASNATL